MGLKQIVQSNEYTIDEERVHLNNLVEVFFPLLESVMGDLLSMNPPPANKTLIEHLISKIFFSANNVLSLKFSSSIATCCPVLHGTSPAHFQLDVLLRVSPGETPRTGPRNPH